MRQRHFVRVAGHFAQRQDDLLPGLHRDRAAFDLADAQLGALQVAQHGQHDVLFLRDAPHTLDARGMRGMIAVREIDAGHRHAGANHGAHDVVAVAGRT